MINLIFPTQLYSDTNYLKNTKLIYLIEEPRYFTDFGFHKLKLAFHRASMKKYYDKLKLLQYNVKYIEYNQVTNTFYKSLTKLDSEINVIYPGDLKLLDKLNNLLGNKMVILPNLNLLINTNKDELDNIKKLIYKNKRYSHEEFYKYQRKKLNILIDKDDKPEGGSWSYDKSNRLPLPKNIKVPPLIKTLKLDKYKKEAIKYIEKNFSDNYGSLDYFIYPIDNKSAKTWLIKFLKTRLANFGAYEDAVSDSEPFVFHSVISPMMNIGLLTDNEVVSISYNYYIKNKKTIKIESFEGFIRQIIGWRNYVYLIYLLEGKNLYESNQLKHKNQINEKFWTGETGILPIDSIINKINKYAYAHHIERLMYLGNFMLICQIDPKEVYRIFMEWSIDSYDWVMIPNVMGMSQYSSSIMMTRPYFSSSNYINRMSTYKVSAKTTWSKIWDALYYAFIDKHQDIFKKNYAIAQQVKNWTKKSEDEQKQIKKIARNFISNLLS